MYMTYNSIHSFFYLFTFRCWDDGRLLASSTDILNYNSALCLKKKKRLLYLVIHQSHHRRCLNLHLGAHHSFWKILFILEIVSVSWENREEGKVERNLDPVLSMEPNMGLDPTTTTSWPELKPRVRPLSARATHAPLVFLRIEKSFFAQANRG